VRLKSRLRKRRTFISHKLDRGFELIVLVLVLERLLSPFGMNQEGILRKSRNHSTNDVQPQSGGRRRETSTIAADNASTPLFQNSLESASVRILNVSYSPTLGGRR
jgi:hypothetical protein